MTTYLLFPVGIFLLFYSVVLSFLFKKRRLASLIWLWGVLGTLILWFIWGFYAIFFTADYQENTSSLRKSAPSFFTDVSKLSYPTDATLEHISTLKLGPNFSENLLLSVSDIDSFINYAIGHYSFYRLKMNYPELEGGEDYKVIYPDFCANFESYWEKRAAAWMEFGYKEGDDVIEGVLIHGLYKGRTEVENKDPFKNFCGTRDVLFTQIKRETEIGIIMVILPKEKLVWLNSTGWF